MPRIFVSHSHEDDTFCLKLIADLRARLGDDAVWFDKSGGRHGLQGGDTWWDKIVTEITERPYFLVVLSPHAHASNWVKQEMGIAFRQHVENDKRLLPLRLADAPRRADWAGIHEFDFTAKRSYNEALSELLSALGVESRVVSPPKPTPARPQQPSYPLPDVPARLASLGFRGVNPTGTPAIVPPLVTVAAGPFLMGSDKARDKEAFDDEIPQHRVWLDAFQIGKYPVTVAEYAFAVRVGAVREPPSRVGVTWKTQLQRLDHPVVCVSWQDAKAYVAWLRGETGHLGWRLSSEAQWEKAARWDAQSGVNRIYPWGDSFDQNRCNTGASGLGATTSVGSYPASDPDCSGVSPYGAEDMAGNVWEWTSSVHSPYPFTPTDGREDEAATENRTLRGGSWDYKPGLARTAYRNNFRMDTYFNLDLGFRLALPA